MKTDNKRNIANDCELSCRIHNCQVKYICIDPECVSDDRYCCEECLDEEHRDHEYKPVREAVQRLQDEAIHALRYQEQCEKYLNIRPDVEQILDSMKQGICQAIDEYKQKILYQVDTQKGSSEIDNANQEQQAKLKVFLNSNQWPIDQKNQELAIALLNMKADKIMNEKVRQVVSHNQFIMKKVNKKMKQLLLQVQLFLDNNFKIFTQADFYNGKNKRGENNFETENNAEYSDDEYNGESSRMEKDYPNYNQKVSQTDNSQNPIKLQQGKKIPSPILKQQNKDELKQTQNYNQSPKVQKNQFKEDAKDEATNFQKLTPIAGVLGAHDGQSNLKNNQMTSNITQPSKVKLYSSGEDKNASIKFQQTQIQNNFQQYENPVSSFETDNFKGIISNQFEGHTDFVRKIVKVDDDNILTISDDSTMKLWNFTHNQCIANFQGLHDRQILDIKRLKQNVFVSCGRDNRLVWLDVDKYYTDVKETNKNILCLEILSERYILLGSIKHLYMVDEENKESGSGNMLQIKMLKENAHEKEEQSVFATAGFDKFIKIWFFQPQKQDLMHIKDLVGHKQAVRSLCVGVRTNLLFSGSDDSQVILWDWQLGQQLRSFTGHTASIYAIEILSPNEIVTGSYDKTIKIWNFNNGKCIGTVSGNQSGILCLLKFNQTTILSGSDDHTIKIWV